MPTYSYRCRDCDVAFDIQQSFQEDTLTVCSQCNGRLRKLFNSVGVVFKGPGFYRTDSRDAASKSPAASGSVKADSGSGAGAANASSGSSNGSSGSGSSSTSSPSSSGSSSGSSSTSSSSSSS